MPMQRWIASAAGGTIQRLKPGFAMVRARSSRPAPGAGISGVTTWPLIDDLPYAAIGMPLTLGVSQKGRSVARGGRTLLSFYGHSSFDLLRRAGRDAG